MAKLKKWQLATLISSLTIIVSLIIAIIVCAIVKTPLISRPVDEYLQTYKVQTATFYNKAWNNNQRKILGGEDRDEISAILNLIKDDAKTTVLDAILTGRTDRTKLQEVKYDTSAVLDETNAMRSNEYVIKLNMLVNPVSHYTDTKHFPFFLKNNDGTAFQRLSSNYDVIFDQILILVNSSSTSKITLAFNGQLKMNSFNYDNARQFYYTQVIEGQFSNLINHLSEIEQ